MADVLETCPFCGSLDLEPDWTCALVRCRTCGAEGPVVGWARTTEERRAAAVVAWNRRAAPPDLEPEAVKILRRLVLSLTPHQTREAMEDATRLLNGKPAPPDALRDELVGALRHVVSALLQLPTGPLSGYTRQNLYDLLNLKGLCTALDRVDAAGEGRGT